MSGERPRSTTVAVERQTFLGSQRSGSNIVTTTPNTSTPSTSPTSSSSTTSTTTNSSSTLNISTTRSQSRTPSPPPPNDQTSTRSSTSFPSSSFASTSNSTSSSTTPAPISSTVYSPPRAFAVHNGLVNIQSTPVLPSTTSFSPATQPSGDRQTQIRGSGIGIGIGIGPRVTQEDSGSPALLLEKSKSGEDVFNSVASFSRSRGQTVSLNSSITKGIAGGVPGGYSVRENVSQSVIVESSSSGFEVPQKEKGGIREKLMRLKNKKKDKRDRESSSDISPYGSPSTPPFSSSSSTSSSHPSPLTKEPSIYGFKVPRFSLKKSNGSTRDAPAQRFPNGCTSSYISTFLLPGESLIGTKTLASFPSYYFDIFNPDPPSSVIDGQLVCTNYRILFVPHEKEKAKFKPLQKSMDPKLDRSEKTSGMTVSIPYRALMSIKLCDRYCAKVATTHSKSDVELLSDEFPSTFEGQDPSQIVDFLLWQAGTIGGRKIPKLLVFSCMDLRQEVFFVRNEIIGRVIGRVIQKLSEPDFNSQAVESFARAAPIPRVPSLVTPLQTLLHRLNHDEEKSLWIQTPNSGSILLPPEVLFPGTVTKKEVQEVANLFNRQMFPQPASVSKKTGAVLWRAPNLSKAETTLNVLKNFLLAAQTRNLPFFILVAGNRPDFASYNRLRVPEGTLAGCTYLCAPTSIDIIQAFGELSSYCFGGPLPPNIDVAIVNGDEESTGLTLEADSEITPNSSALRNWLQQFENSRWYGCMSQISVAVKVVVARMEEGKHVLLGSAVSGVISILVEIMREPENRTIQGFFRLLEREWIQGHYKSTDFNSILTLSRLTSETDLSLVLALSRSTDEAPILLILLFDCIFQLMAVNPTRFEFTQDLLLALLDENLMCRFDSSITLSHDERKRLPIGVSLWDYMSLSQFANKTLSARYDRKDLQSTEPLESRMELIPWTSLYLRFSYRWEMASFSATVESVPSDFCKLDFNGKGLPWFPPGILGKWANIQILDLSHNSLCFLPIEISTLRHLVGLRLAHNNLLQIGEKDIGELIALQELDITGNRVQGLSGLEKMNNLLKLKIAGNRLTSMPKLPASVQRFFASDNPFSNRKWEDFPPKALLYLDLAKCSLSSIPFPIETCTNLQTLILAKNQLSFIPSGLSSLQLLHSLVLNENNLKCIPPPVFQLKNLKNLSINQCELSTIEDNITELQSLEKLYLSKNHITVMPISLFSLKSLTLLDLSGNGLVELSKNIQLLTKLQELHLARNEISRIPHEIRSLSQLTKLDFSFCRVEHIPPELGLLTTLKELKVQGNNLKTPPVEIAAKGIVATMSFLRALCGSDVQLSYKLKVSVVGPPLSGKTSAITRLNNITSPTSHSNSSDSGLSCIRRPVSTAWGSSDNLQQLPTHLRTSEVQPTLNLNATGAWPNRKPVTLNFWEFEGAQEYTHTTHKFFLTDGSLYLVVMDLSEPVENANLDYWLNSIKKGAPQSPIIVIATHMDKVSKQVVTSAVDSVMNDYGNLVDAVVPVSSLKELGFDRVWEAIEIAIQQALLVGELVPIRFSTLEGLLRTESVNTPLITWKEFESLCSNVHISSAEAESALFMLQKNGSGPFRFSDPQELADWVVIRPSWLVEMVAKLGNQKNLCPNGIMHHSLLKDIWNTTTDRCAARYHPFLIQLLLKFQLGFCLTPDVNEILKRKSFLSILLQRERPSELEKEWPVFSDTEWCRRDYTLASLPEGFFARCQVNLLARRPSWMPSLAWANGMLIKTNQEVILFEQLPTAKKIQLTIRRYVSGTLFTLVDEDIRTQAKYYNIALKVTMPCVHCYRKRLYDAYEFSLRECEMALESGSSLVFCHGLVPVRLDKVAPDIALSAVADRKVNYNELQFQSFIAEGGYAMVYKAKYNDIEVAVKVLKGKDEDGGWEEKEKESETTLAEPTAAASMEELRREVWIMSGLLHSNIVSLLGYCINPPCIISEFIPEGNLLDLIKDEKKALSPGLVLRIACDIAQALEFLHVQLNPPMIHNDLKSPNVLLASTSETAPVVAKLADFGMSRRAAWGNLQDKSAVNPRWLAPEVIQGEAFTPKADVYSFGVIVWELVSRQMFMEEQKFMYTIRDKILSGARPPIPSNVFPQLAELITDCWAQKPEERPDIINCEKVLTSLLTEKFPPLAEIANTARAVVRSRSTAPASTSGGALRRDMPGKSPTSEQLPEMTVLTPVGHSSIVGSVRCMVRCSKWKQVWCGDGTGRITVFSEAAIVQESLYCHDKEILDLVATNDYVFSLSTDGMVKAWNKKMEMMKTIPVGDSTAIGRVQGKIWVGGETEILVFDKRSFKQEKKIKISTADTGGGIITCMLVKKPYVWLGTSSNILRLDIQTMRVVDVLRGHSRIIHKMISVGKEVWSCSSDRSIRVWDKNSGKCLQTLSAHSGRVFSLAVERGTRPVVWSCAWDATILIWDVTTKQMLSECSPSHKDAVSSLVQVGGYMWSGSWDNKLCQWQTIGLRVLLDAVKTGEIESLLLSSNVFSLAEDSMKLAHLNRRRTKVYNSSAPINIKNSGSVSQGQPRPEEGDSSFSYSSSTTSISPSSFQPSFTPASPASSSPSPPLSFVPSGPSNPNGQRTIQLGRRSSSKDVGEEDGGRQRWGTQLGSNRAAWSPTSPRSPPSEKEN